MGPINIYIYKERESDVEKYNLKANLLIFYFL
jgi:hypothetical protein